jgi:2-polyprenyl-6-hydroxyphenyl methylase/3-demethylubiquinone-9 3-methyltransferase
MQTAETPRSPADPTHAAQVERGQRFEFGENWRRFLSVLDEDRISEAERSLKAMLGVEDLRGRTFVDVGSGSGLFSLAAARLGAERVHSFDFDPSSVGCTLELRRRYGDGLPWTVEQGSALDEAYLRRLGTFDIVYSWGVLHHTGDMWRGLANVDRLVAPGGRLFISIYNDQGRRSRIWRGIKRVYNALPERLRAPYVVLVMARQLVWPYLTQPPWRHVRRSRQRDRSRGMNRWHDMVDWVGGLPFEVATPDAIFDFYRELGYVLERLVTRQGIGCNEFVFRRVAEHSPRSD